MKKISFLILLITSVTFSQIENLEKKFDSVLSNYKSLNEPGIAAGILKNGKILYLKSFGVEDVESQKPITTQTKFQVDDLGKQFTVLALLKLIVEKKITLEDDVRKYLQYLPEYKHTLKVKHLLNNSSGLHNLTPIKELLNIRQNDVFTQTDAVKIISAQEVLNFKPGTQFSYHTSDSEIILIVELIKAVTKSSFQSYTKQHIFEALGMKNTVFDNSRNILSNSAKSYSIRDNTVYNPINDLTLGVTNLYTTAEDVAKFYQSFNDTTKISELVRKLDNYIMLDSGKNNNSTWGKTTLGRYYDHPERGLPKMSWQFGLIGGYGANVFRFHSHNIVSFVLGNNNRYNGMPAMNLASQLLENEYTEPSEIDYSKIKFMSLSSKELQQFEDIYWDKTNSVVREIYVKNDTLRCKLLSNNAETALLPITKNKFQFYLQGDTEVFITFNKENLKYSSLGSDEKTFDRIELINPKNINFEEFVGAYYNQEYDVVLHFSIKENALLLSNFNTNSINFFPIVKDAFRSNTYMYSGVKFIRSNNTVKGFHFNTDGVKNLYFKKLPNNF